MEEVIISVDALGGDNAPQVVLDGVVMALEQDPALKVLLVGPADVVEPFASAHERVEAVVATQSIDMGEHPATAVRTKRDSSIVVGCKLVKDGRAQGFFSAGSTGACLTAATLVMGRIKGIKRPALATVLPAPEHPVVLTDVGANADCKPEYLLQFGQMGAVYARIMLGYEQPRIALLNIGSEDTKGSQFAQETFSLMKEQLTGFVGNAEGNDLLRGGHDVFVTDGFTGNVVLKSLEGAFKMIMDSLKGIMMAKTSTKLAGALLKPQLREFKHSVDPDAYGGAPLLGVKGVCIIGHGSSKPKAIASGIAATAKAVRMDMVSLIESQVS
ncbi:MAG: phosphate acyltransferase PlsX [Coriobacteriales bacterium]|nr:phosphate acyltransferase PlsX [Coriobacteriales bacterium]